MKRKENMYPSPEEIKDQEIESNKCNYPKNLILFYEFPFVHYLRPSFSIQIVFGTLHLS